MNKRGLAILLAVIMLYAATVPAYGEGGASELPPSGGEMTYMQDFSGVSEDHGAIWEIDDAWQGNHAQIVNGRLTNLSTGMYGLKYKYATPQSGTYTVQFDLQSAPAEPLPWTTMYVGLRLSDFDKQANEPDGLWLAFRDNQIGMRTNAWPETAYIAIDYDFFEPRQVFIEDHVDENVVKIFVSDDNGIKTPVAQVHIVGGTVNMYAADDLAAPAISTALPYSLGTSGYINWWVHYTTGVSIGEAAVVTDQGANTVQFPNDTAIANDIWEMNNAQVAGGALTNPTGGLYGLRFKKKPADTGSYRVRFDLASQPAETDPWMTAYVGLRLDSPVRQAIDANGLWLAFRDHRIGIRTGDWPSTEYVEIPWSFGSLRTVELVDDVDRNLVKIYVADDQGDMTFAAQVVIGSDSVKLFRADDLTTPAVSSSSSHGIARTGFIHWWVHHVPNIVLDNITVTMEEFSRPPYVPAIPFQYRDVYSDTWAAADDLGRTMPTYVAAGGPEDKKIGIFYFMWHDAVSGQIYDHNRIYAEGGTEAIWDAIPQGPLGFAHYWGQPYFGYYRSDDRWVIRKHATMLTEAGIDFLFLDCSNNILYRHILDVILDEYRKMRSEGLATPQIAFFFGDNSQFGKEMTQQVWDEIYKDDYYNELWFKVDGKPLVLGNLMRVPGTIREQFTVRQSWAFNEWTGDGEGRWPWIAEYPQTPGKDPVSGEIEQVSVASGYHANSSKGRSFADGEQPTTGLGNFEFGLETTPLGLAYNEQWKRAYELDPEYVMLTGWNEWWAGRWENDADGQRIANTYTVMADDPLYKHYYVDNFNSEFSRDLEPMAGGFRDNYYYQTVRNVRQFKGVRPVPAAFGQKKINSKRPYEDWTSVGPEFRDTLGDTLHRDSPSFAGVHRYRNESGRNDIEYAKVSQDNKYWYFYVRTREELTKPEGTNWMNLFIDSDRNAATGWEGYDFLINRNQANGEVSIERNRGDGWSWTAAGRAEYDISGREMYIAVPKSVLKLQDEAFDFKWADNSAADGDVMQFLDLGDTAPNGRFNFRYTTESRSVELSEELTGMLRDGAVAMKVNTYEAYAGLEKVLVDRKDTNVTPIGSDGQVYIPAEFLKRTAKKPVDKKQIKKINGTDFVELHAAAAILGRRAAVGENGVVVFTAAGDASDAVLNELFRKL